MQSEESKSKKKQGVPLQIESQGKQQIKGLDVNFSDNLVLIFSVFSFSYEILCSLNTLGASKTPYRQAPSF